MTNEEKNTKENARTFSLFVIRHTSFSSAFTLIELLVTISIFVFMTALLLSRYGAFNQGTLLTNLAYDVALTIRTAQTYGISVKDATGSNLFTSSYGVDFDTTNPTKFFLFSDGDAVHSANGIYDSANGDKIVSTYNLKNGAKLVSGATGLCSGTAQTNCASYSGIVNKLDITFKRPDPQAIICTNGSASSCSGTYSQITIQSNDGTSQHTIVVRQNGQILVANSSILAGSPSGSP